MTPRQRVEANLRGERTDRVPFTVYDCMLPSPPVLAELKARGLCVVHRLTPFKTDHPNCKIKWTDYEENGKKLRRMNIRTPVGDLHSIHEPVGFTSWTHKHLFDTPDDYNALAFYLNDAVYEPCYDEAMKIRKSADDATILRGTFGLEPMQQLISGDIFGTEGFCIQWMDNRDEVLRLYDILVEKRREVYPMVADAPVLHANYGGNVVPEIIGPENFRKYYAPHYQEAAEAMHARGKFIGVHFDANCGPIKDDIAALDLDYIEAFTPAPDTDMTMGEAVEAWPGKVLWINFPSSVHLRPEDEVESVTRELIEAAVDARGFIIGITEDVPAGRVDGNYRAIMRGVEG